MGGGTFFAMQRIVSFEITPGPPGILPTSPIDAAPFEMAIFASVSFLMQQILM
jgi:hypothetical protein